MKPDLELAAWREQWQADTEVPADLRRKVERGSRNLRLLLALEVLITAVLGGGSTLLATMDRRTEMLVLSAAVWLVSGRCLGVSADDPPRYPVARGSVHRRVPRPLHPPLPTEVGILGVRRRPLFRRDGILPHLALLDPARREPLPAIIFSVATPIFVVELVRYRRKTRAELERLLALQRHPQ